MTNFETIFPLCRSLVSDETWNNAVGNCSADCGPEAFPEILSRQADGTGDPPYTADLARLELAVHLAGSTAPFHLPPEQTTVNPSLQLLDCAWNNLWRLRQAEKDSKATPEKIAEKILIWRQPDSTTAHSIKAANDDLLALKIILEELSPEQVARDHNLPVGAVDRALDRAARAGLLLTPDSRLQRDPLLFAGRPADQERFRTAEIFTLQWHITQRCDLNCRHCYDRSDRTTLPLSQGLAVLDDMRSFCRQRHVAGQISFSGGNPLLYPHFMELYAGAVERGLAVAILGNPAPKKQIEELVAIDRPVFYQVSLEGLREHNDYIRGAGHFDRVMTFLEVLRDLNIFSMVMLTLTRDNQDQVLPLAELLRNKTDHFTFNRLSLVGEGASLAPVGQAGFPQFLTDYMRAATDNPIMGLKDNFFNIIRHRQSLPLTGGCAGFGCGAAFNFLSLLPDGEAHACRKFPSPIGNTNSQSLAEIYDSTAAQGFRAGCKACSDCAIRPACGGCLAVAQSFGYDTAKDPDPYCFIADNS